MGDFKQNNLPFRPLDNSMSTQTRYDLEAEKWRSAMKSASNKNSSTISDLGLIDAIIDFSVDLIFWVITLLIETVKLIVRLIINRKKKVDNSIVEKAEYVPYDVPDSELEKPW